MTDNKMTPKSEAQAWIEARKKELAEQAAKAPEPDAGFWEEARCDRGLLWLVHDRYAFVKEYGNLFRAESSQVIARFIQSSEEGMDVAGVAAIGGRRNVKTAEEAKRLIEQDMERREKERMDRYWSSLKENKAKVDAMPAARQAAASIRSNKDPNRVFTQKLPESPAKAARPWDGQRIYTLDTPEGRCGIVDAHALSEFLDHLAARQDALAHQFECYVKMSNNRHNDVVAHARDMEAALAGSMESDDRAMGEMQGRQDADAARIAKLEMLVETLWGRTEKDHDEIMALEERPLKWSDLKRPICWVRGHDWFQPYHTRRLDYRTTIHEQSGAPFCLRCNKPQPDPRR